MLNTFSVPALIAWLETQDPATEYDFIDGADCLICRYFRAQGIPLGIGEVVNPMSWRDKNGMSHPLPAEFNNISNGGGKPWNYGAALARAKATLGAPTL